MRKVVPTGIEPILTHRPSASAGSRHPIDVLVLSPILDSGKMIYYYNSFEHNLNKLTIAPDLVKNFLHHLDSILSINSGTILWFVAHPERTSVKYEHPLSLIWRDAGALIHCVQVACSAQGLNSCALGSLGEPFISEMFSNEGTVFGVGGIVVG